MNLNIKQRQYLKGLIRPFKPVILLGSSGLTEGVPAEIEQALEYHEFIEMRIAAKGHRTKILTVETIMRRVDACNVQVIGKTLVLYHPIKECRISLPR